MLLQKLKMKSAFTIVELLIIIAITAVLATILGVSYRGLVGKANDSSALASLSDSVDVLNLYSLDYGSYPTAFDANNCPTLPQADSSYCLKKNPSRLDYIYSSDGSTFDLTAADTTTKSYYNVTSDTAPKKINGYYKQAALGFHYTCAIAVDGNAYCWGNNESGELGTGSLDSSVVPVAVNRSGALAGLNIKSISANGNYHTCAIASDNNAYCWGDNGWGGNWQWNLIKRIL